MAKSPKPGIGHNSLPEHKDIQSALAMEMIFEEQTKSLNEKRKRARLRMVEGKGITQDDLKFLKQMKDKTPSEIIDLFKRQWHNVGAIYRDAFEQMDLFSKKSDAPTRAAYFTMGLMVGLQGKDLEIPPAVVGDDRQLMIDGHNEGRQRRKDAEAGILGEALDPKNAGKVTDGTAGAVGKKAAEDFAKDNGGNPLVVDGVTYPNMRQANAARRRSGQQPAATPPSEGDLPRWTEYPLDSMAWTDEQKDVFCKWFDAQPLDTKTPADMLAEIEHPGARAEFTRLMELNADIPPEEEKTGFLHDTDTKVLGDDVQPPLIEEEIVAPPAQPVKKSLARPDFHSWDEDWEKWTGSQDMEFRRWFESLPADTTPAITHPGAVAMFNMLKEERDNRELAGGDEGFEMSEDELAAQAARPSRQAAETPDPREVDEAARKLQDSGFTDSPAKGRRKAKA